MYIQQNVTNVINSNYSVTVITRSAVCLSASLRSSLLVSFGNLNQMTCRL